MWTCVYCIYICCSGHSVQGSACLCLLYLYVYVCVRACVHVFVCVPAHCSLKAEPSSILRNRELTEYGQTFAVAIIIAGFRSTERASGAASILVLV